MDEAILGGKGAEQMQAFLMAKVKGKAARTLPTTRAALERDRTTQHKELLLALGLDPLPKRTPLNARITRVTRRKGYRVENLVFESRPNFPVTAQLYIPEGLEGKKLPVIVNPIGHWKHKKAQTVVQSRMIFEALHGYLGVIVDSPGFSFEGDALVERRSAGTHFDLKLILGSTNATTVYIWDLMRVLDYLETQPEADMSRVGLTGASGGGLATVYAFAAEPRFKCAVPVVYASSLEVNPDNGCQCNHIPGTLQIGDRSDVLGLRAPAPVLIIGAAQDGEFPAAGMQRTGEKLKKLWGLYGAEADTDWRIFPGGHDYNQAMQELAIGFFDRHLRDQGDGSPVSRPPVDPVAEDDPQMFCQPDPPTRTETMRGIAEKLLARARPQNFAAFVRINGGLPETSPLNFREIESNSQTRPITFESEKGLTIPGILWLPTGNPRASLILISEKGKGAASEEFGIPALLQKGFACFAIDARGFGELSGLDLRLMAYLGTGVPFAMGWDVARAAEGVRRYAPKVAVLGRGPAGAQAALFAALLAPQSIGFVAGLNGPRDFADIFREEMPEYAIQPRAAYCAPLPHLRSLVRQKAVWTFIDGPTNEWTDALSRWAESG